jgi:hypothetical protein
MGATSRVTLIGLQRCFDLSGVIDEHWHGLGRLDMRSLRHLICVKPLGAASRTICL